MKELKHGLYLTQSSVNLTNIRNTCKIIYDKVKDLPLDESWYSNDGQKFAPNTTKSFNQYNIFTFPLPEVNELYHDIKKFFYDCEKQYYGTNLKCNYFTQAWINVYKKDQFIDWHSHNYSVARAWHGFFCATSEPSETIYKFTDSSLLSVPSYDGQIVLGLSENNQHKTNPWQFNDRDRITIAFDIIDRVGLKDVSPNHWIPI